MRTLFLATAAFAALVMVAPIGKAHAYLNRGDKVHVSGVVADHSVGSVDLKDCEFRVDVSEAVKMQGAVTGAGLY
jgi:hypothetical protein